MGIFGEHFTETVTLERSNGTNSWGDTTYATGVSVNARIERDRRETLTDTGQEVVSETQLFTEAQVAQGDRVTIDIDGTSKTFTVLAALKHFDLDGVESHYEVML